MSRYLIYALVDPRTRERFYVGQSSRGLNRPRSHWANHSLKDRTPKAAKVREIIGVGLAPMIEVLQFVTDPDEAMPPPLHCWTGDDVCALDVCEQRWIDHGRRSGWPLTNRTDGGDGARGMVITEMHRANMSKAAKGRPKPEFTAEHRANMSKAAKGKPKSPEHVARMAATKTGQKQNPETTAKIAAANTGHTVSQETRKRIRDALRTSPKAIAQRERLFAAAVGKKRRGWTEEAKARLRAARAAHPRRTGPFTDEHRAKLSRAKRIASTGRWLGYLLAGVN